MKATAAKRRLVICTTVPETLAHILAGQPRFLSKYFEITIITSSGPELRALEPEGVPIVVVDMLRKISPIADVRAILSMANVLKHIKPHIVHSYTPKAGLICMVSAWLARVPIRVHTFTGLIWPTKSRFVRHILIAVDKLICLLATNIVPESLGIRHALLSKKITRKQLNMIGYGNIAGVDLDYFHPAQCHAAFARSSWDSESQDASKDFIFVYVGRLNKDKGLNELVVALAALPPRCKLLVVGSVDTSAPVSHDVLTFLSSSKRVKWIGFQRDIRPALKSSRVLVLPSYREGFPNVILQAAAMGVPCIASNISGCNEFIQDEVNGWLVPPGDADALADVMRRVSELPLSSIKEIGEKCREIVEERYERSFYLGQLLEFYYGLCEKRFSTPVRR